MTNNEVIKKALQELGVVAFNGTATNSQAQDCLDILNGMMAEWEQQDIDINWFPQDTLSETCPIPRWAENGVISNLAVTASASFRAPLTEGLVQKATQGFNTIFHTVMKIKLQPSDMDHISKGSNGRWDINTDS